MLSSTANLEIVGSVLGSSTLIIPALLILKNYNEGKEKLAPKKTKQEGLPGILCHKDSLKLQPGDPRLIEPLAGLGLDYLDEED